MSLSGSGKDFKEIAGSIYVKLAVVLLLGLPVAVLISEVMTPWLVQLGAGQLTRSIVTDFEKNKIDAATAQEISDKYGLNFLNVSQSSNKRTIKAGSGVLPKNVSTGSRITDRNDTKFLEVAEKVGDLDVQYGLRVQTLGSLFQSGNFWTTRMMLPQVAVIGFQMLLVTVLLMEFALLLPLRVLVSAAERFRTITDGLLGELRKPWSADEVVKGAEVFSDLLRNAPTQAPGAPAAENPDMITKSIDERFLERARERVLKCTSVTKSSYVLLHLLGEEMPADAEVSGFVVIQDEMLGLRISDSMGIPDSVLNQLDGTTEEALAWRLRLRDVTSITKITAAGVLPAVGIRETKLILAPLSDIGPEKMIIVMMVNTDAAASKMERLVKRLHSVCGPVLKLIWLRETEYTVNRKDKMTGFPNQRALDDFCAEVNGKKQNGGPPPGLSCIMFEGDHFMFYNASYGRAIGDQLIIKLGEVIQTKARALAKDFTIYRLNACRFLFVYEGERAFAIAEAIRKSVQEESNWPKIHSWTISAGIGQYPQDGNTLEEVIMSAECCLEFVKSLSEDNRVMVVETLPRAFLARAKGDDTPVFDPFHIIQTYAWQQGVISSKDSHGRQFVVSVKDGRLENARLGTFTGDMAVLEYLTTFEEGTFDFKEGNMTQQRDIMTRLGPDSEVASSLGELMVTGTNARQKLVRARAVVNRMDSYLFPLPLSQTDDVWDRMTQTEDPPDEFDLLVMKAIIEVASGNLKFPEVAAKLSEIPIPTYLVWHGTAVLLNNKLMKFSNFRVAGDRAVQ